MRYLFLILVILFTIAFTYFFRSGKPSAKNMTSGHTLYLSTPSIHNEYYADAFDNIIKFQTTYVKAVLEEEVDDIKIIVDRDTKSYFEGKVPEDVLIISDIEDIWMRDFSSINPHDPIQFRYTPVSFDEDQRFADRVQKSFNRFARQNNIDFEKTDYFLDGGNIVDDYRGRVITTERFLEDNFLEKEEGKGVLRELLSAQEVAIIPADDDVLAHSDGMVMFVEENKIIVNEYEEPFRSQVLDELKESFNGIKIIEMETQWKEDSYDPNISSACGIHVNSVVTPTHIYMPHFGVEDSDNALQFIQSHTSKKVIPIPAQDVCSMGGSVRCLTWQRVF